MKNDQPYLINQLPTFYGADRRINFEIAQCYSELYSKVRDIINPPKTLHTGDYGEIYRIQIRIYSDNVEYASNVTHKSAKTDAKYVYLNRIFSEAATRTLSILFTYTYSKGGDLDRVKTGIQRLGRLIRTAQDKLSKDEL